MHVSHHFGKNDWALVLGASSGFGGATAVELARRGMSIFGVHFDRAATMPNVERIVGDIRASGAAAHFFNINASDPAKRTSTIAAIKKAYKFLYRSGLSLEEAKRQLAELAVSHPEVKPLLDFVGSSERGIIR